MTTHASHEAHRARLPCVAAAAASILGALYFVPSASATAERPPTTAARQATTITEQQLADTGSVDTTPYVIGGAAFLAVGAALLVNASRRARAEAADGSDDEGADGGAEGADGSDEDADGGAEDAARTSSRSDSGPTHTR